MWIWITSNETLHLIGAIVVILFIGGLGLKTLGFLHFGKIPCNTARGCQDPKCQANVEQTAKDLAALKQDNKTEHVEILGKIDENRATVTNQFGKLMKFVGRVEQFMNGVKK